MRHIERAIAWLWRHPFISLFLVALICHIPILLHGIPVDADDAGIHLRWQTHYANEIVTGNFFPRWMHQLNEGYGSPAFFLYPPLSHFLSALMSPLLPAAGAVPYRLAAAICFASYIGSSGVYLWLRQASISQRSAVIGAIIYAIVPYHLVIDTYMRVSFAELWAFSWAPWTLMAIHCFSARPTRGVLLFTFSAAALLTSHAPSSVFLFPAYCVYAGAVARSTGNWRVVFYTGGACIVSIMIAGAYLIPALLQQRLVNTAALFSGYFEIKNWLFFSKVHWVSVNREILFTVSALMQSIATIALGWRALAAHRDITVRTLIWTGLIGTVFVFFFMSAPSLPVWELAGVARKIQFPWRLLMLQSLFLALLTAFYCDRPSSANLMTGKALDMVLLPSVIAMFAFANVGVYMLTKNAHSYDQTKIRQYEPSEYRLGNVEKLNLFFPNNSRVAILGGDGTIGVKTWKSRRISLEVAARTPLHVVLHQYYYPGWEFRTNEAVWMQAAEVFSQADPLLSAHFPAGNYKVEFMLSPTVGEKIGEQISIAGLVALMLFLGLTAFRASRCHADRLK